VFAAADDAVAVAADAVAVRRRVEGTTTMSRNARMVASLDELKGNRSKRRAVRPRPQRIMESARLRDSKARAVLRPARFCVRCGFVSLV
jgi:hypothetical protein